MTTATAEFKTIGLNGPAYEVLEKGADFVKIQILSTGEYKNDPSA